MSPTQTPTQCEGCSSKFSWLRKRRTCLMCRSVCCSSCMQRLRLCGVGRQCLRCVRLSGVRYERAALQQMTVRDLKHIMKIVDVSPATCREKSDLVDSILMCRESAGQADSPAVQTPPALGRTAVPSGAIPTAPDSSAHRPGRVRPGDSIRVGPYESIRVRAVDDSELNPPAKQPNVSGHTGGSDSSSASLSLGENEDGFVVVDVETTDVGEDVARSIEVETPVIRPAEVDGETPVIRPAEVDGERPADVEVDRVVEVDVDVEADAQVDAEAVVDVAAAARETGAGAGGDDDDGDDQEVVDDDPDEPQSESVAIEVDKEKRGNADDPVSETEVDLSRVTDVAQLPSEELISRLTVRQCKRLLQHRRTEYRDVIEKEELLRRVRQLWKETKRNSAALASAPDRDICKICMDSLVDCVLLECGHMATCTACGKQMAECPICRKYVVRVVHVFRS